MEVIYSGRASVHHNRETNASRAAQFCSWGFLNIFTSASDDVDGVMLVLAMQQILSSEFVLGVLGMLGIQQVVMQTQNTRA